MATRLGDRLTADKRMALSALSLHPGFMALKELIQEECDEATKKVMKLSPDEDRYVAKLSRLQLEARALHEFAASLLLSMEFQSKVVEHESKKKQSTADTILASKEKETDLE